MGPIGVAFAFLLSILGIFVPLILIANRGEGVRRFAVALILSASVAGCLVAAFSLVREPAPFLDLSWVTPFPFSLAVDRLSAFFLLLVCSVAIPVTLFGIPYFDLHYSELRRHWIWALF
jgi:formate hydrogenlyase subunit 3/multisubunit Na+/H+ antiporter MnhD subunit